MAVLFAQDFTSATARRRRLASGAVRELSRGIWTDEISEDPADVVQRHWRTIVGTMMPGAVVTGRSAFDLRPMDGQLFVSHARATPLTLPGLTVYPDGRTDWRRSDDIPLDKTGALYGASQVRALIDNAETRGRPGGVQRRLTRDELHDKVAHIVTTSTRRQVENILDQIGDEVNSVAAESIRVFFEAAQGNIRTVKTGSRAMNAAQRGETYDAIRAARFKQYAADLSVTVPTPRYVADPRRAEYTPFYEAYFSNYIEGTTFTIEEAREVVFSDADFGRPDDAHDVAATYRIVADRGEMGRPIADADEFLDALQERHQVMMAAHPNKHPGQWKTQRNQAGATTFVDPEHVVGTLRAGWEEGQLLTDPFHRAVYIMFLVSEVHPFTDGNGRSARVAMNAELVRHDLHRIVVPTVARIDYMSALRKASVDNGIDGLNLVLGHLQHWTANAEFSSLDDGDRYLRATNASLDSGIAEREGQRLIILRAGELWELPDAQHRSYESAEPDSPAGWIADGAAAGQRHPKGVPSGGQ